MKRPLPTHLYNQKVSVYRNLNDQCLSVLYKQLVAGHAVTVILANVQFRVREGRRQNVLKTNRKNVHAFVDGTLVECSEKKLEFQLGDGVPVIYIPKVASYFYERQSGKPVHSAKTCVITPSGFLAYF